MTNQPSLFNDVIGPVMRGPSSSHTAASWRIAQTAVQILEGELQSAVIEFDKSGAWADNFREQGTELGMSGGLVGIDIKDNRIKDFELIVSEEGVNILYQISSFENDHANSMRLTLTDSKNIKSEILAVSLGGGSFEIQKIDSFNISIKGNQHDLLIFSDQDCEDSLLKLFSGYIGKSGSSFKNQFLFNLKNHEPFSDDLMEQIKKIDHIIRCVYVRPMMPIIQTNQSMPDSFDIDKIVKYGIEKNLSLGQLGLKYEKYFSGLRENELIDRMHNTVDIIEQSITTGLSGTFYEDRIYPQQSHLIKLAEKKASILNDTLINDIIRNVTTIMESKSALELIVANPTAGSCGTIGGVITAVANSIGNSDEEKLMAYFASGLIGIYIAEGPGFSAEEHGCQVECGAASAMAAAGIVQLYGGTVEQAFGAASVALQNMIGLVCDPIADRVEAPCLGKNVSAAVNALASATMVASGYRHLIPFKQVLDTVERVSADMPSSVKCTGTGGLSITPAAKEIKEDLKKNKL